VTNLQVRLLASALGLIAAAILSHHSHHEVRVAGIWATVIAGVVFCVEYVRAQKP
jgi:hypothetical protein